MLGTLNRNQKKVTIIGAGISGMLAAYYLDKAGYEVSLFEAQPRAGGLIQTKKNEFGIVETAAHSILATSLLEDLCTELQVELTPVRPDSKARYILRANRIRRFPLTLWEVLKTLFRAYFVLADRQKNPHHLTLEEWTNRYLGKAALKYLLTPFVSGIYGARPSDLAVGAAFPKLVVPHGNSLLSFLIGKLFRKPKNPVTDLPKKESSHSLRGMVAPVLGMGALLEKLENHLIHRLGERFHKNFKIDGFSKIDLSSNLMLAVSATEAARLLSLMPKFDSKNTLPLIQQLQKVNYTPLVTVTVFAEKKGFEREKKGVGLLVAAEENRKILGVLFNSSTFQGRVCDEVNWSSFTVMLGGTSHPEWAQKSDQDIESAILEEFQSLFGFDSLKGKIHLTIHRWEKAIPCYDLTLLQTWELAQSTWCSEPGHLLFGNYTGQVSIRGMLENAYRLANKI